MGGNEGQERSRNQQAADNGDHHGECDAGSERRKRRADGGEDRRRDHAIGLPSRKIGFEALPIGLVKHDRNSPSLAPAGGVIKRCQTVRDMRRVATSFTNSFGAALTPSFVKASLSS